MKSFITLVLIGVALTALSACDAAQVRAIQVACKVDAVAQPIAVALAPLAGQDVAAIANADQKLLHPAVVAACAGVGGIPVAVTTGPG